MIHAVDALAGNQNVSPGPYSRASGGEPMVSGSFQARPSTTWADTRAGVVVVTGIARLPPQIEPRFRMLIAPQQHRLTGPGAVEPPGLDERGSQLGPFRAFVRRQRPVAGGDRPQPRCV